MFPRMSARYWLWCHKARVKVAYHRKTWTNFINCSGLLTLEGHSMYFPGGSPPVRLVFSGITKNANAWIIGSLERFLKLKTNKLQNFLKTSEISKLQEGSDKSPFVQRLKRCQTIDEIFDAVALQKGPVYPHELSFCFNSLYQVVYSQLKKCTWAYDDDQILWVQITLNSECQEYFIPVLRSPTFHYLCKQVEKNLEVLSLKEMVSILHDILYLNLPPSLPVSIALQQKCLERMPEFDLEDMACFAGVSNCMRRSGFHQLSRLCQIFDPLKEGVVTVDNVPYIASLLHNISYFSSPKLISDTVHEFAEAVRQEGVHVHPEYSIQILSVVARYGHAGVQSDVDVIIQHAWNRLDKLNISYLNRLVIYVKKLKYLSEQMAKEAQIRGVSLMHEGFLKSSDVIGLLSIFDRCNYSEDIADEMCNLVSLHINDFDTLLLKHFSVSDFLVCHDEYVEQFSKRVLQKFGDIMQSPSCLTSILSFFTVNKYENKWFHSMVTDFLLDDMHNGGIALQTEYCFVFCNYILQTIGLHRPLPSSVKETILHRKDQFSLLQISRLLASLHHLSQTKHTKKQVNSVATPLIETIYSRQNEITHVMLMNSLIKTLVSISPQSTRRTHVANMLPKLEELVKHSATLTSVNSTASVVILNRIYSEIILESLSDIVYKNMDKINLQSLMNYLKACATVDFCSSLLTPIANSLVEKLISQRAKWAKSDGDNTYGRDLVQNIIFIANMLAVLNIFPEKLLRLIFDKDFLIEVDNVLQTHKTNLAIYLMSLNRAVVLQCPELDIPWFHEAYCQTVVAKTGIREISRQKQVVKDALTELLGGEEFFRSHVYSPYYYTIDYECLLTSRYEPVAYGSGKDISSLPLSVRRIAILLLYTSHYCTNVERLTGKSAMKVRHLEILGYTVVQIPWQTIENIGISESKNIESFIRKQLIS